jgi:hypothetical protein
LRRDRRRLTFEDRRGELGLGGRVERPPAGQHLVEDRAEREQIRSRVDPGAAQLLGRHVRQRPEQDGLVGRGIVGERLARLRGGQ